MEADAVAVFDDFEALESYFVFAADGAEVVEILAVGLHFVYGFCAGYRFLIVGGVCGGIAAAGFADLGYREFFEYGTPDEAARHTGEIAAQIKLNTWHYAKKQLTWFKKKLGEHRLKE